MAVMNVAVRMLDGHVAIGQQEGGHVMLLDRPIATGGTGLGFNGGHLMLISWGACFKSTLLAAAEARGFKVSRLELAISGETADAPYRFETISMEIDLEVVDNEEQRQHLIDIAEKGCAVSNTLRLGTDMKISLKQSR